MCLLELLEEIRRDKKEFELAMVNEPLVFEVLRFGCIFRWIFWKRRLKQSD